MMVRLKLHLKGTVQGVGFRPFVYRAAKGLGLRGYVINDTTGVVVEVEGPRDDLDRFLWIINHEKPPLADIYHQETRYEKPAGYDGFEIRRSINAEQTEAVLLPDIATCEECLKESIDSGDRRYLYPFINCTNCGPRFTIIESLPYDRPNTSMRNFQMCPECRSEYNDPSNRRFHAQPNACPLCGPNVWIVKSDGLTMVEGRQAIKSLIKEIKDGGIVAMKGIGGFHLLCDATNNAAVALLRKRKGRSDKPFAVMFRDMEQLREYAGPALSEESLLLLPSRPIVLVRKKRGVLDAVSPGLNSVGAFLPYSPLHYILLEGVDFPVVATSGNLSEEPIVKENDEAIERLSPISDFFLLHNRPIHRRCDDSIVKVVGGHPQILRRSRGYVPLPVLLPSGLGRRVLAVGGHLKNTFAIGFGDRIILGQHIGDMETPEGMEYFEEAIDDLSSIYKFEPDVIAHDLHPGYETTRWAIKQEGVEKVAIQHHYAHILSCMAENGVSDRVAGVAWDGTGYGDDGTLWGGEFLLCDINGYERAFHFKPLRLIGGEKAVREPRRVALSILFGLFKEKALTMDISPVRSFKEKELALLWMAWQRGINSPLSSSAGRLFDALASFLDVIQVCTYEAQAAMIVEDLFDPAVKDCYTYSIRDGQIDWLPTFHDILQDREKTRIPTRFINTLAKITIEVVRLIGEERVCLSGGVFQNSPLCNMIINGLQKEGFRIYTHRVVPANDGGISLGQAFYGGMTSDE